MINRDHKQDSSAQTQTAVPAEVGAHKHGCICTMCGVCEYWAGEKGPFHPDSYVPMPQLLTSRGDSWSGRTALSCGNTLTVLQTFTKNTLLIAEVTHNHPEGIKVAQVVAVTIFLAEVFSGVPEGL